MVLSLSLLFMMDHLAIAAATAFSLMDRRNGNRNQRHSHQHGRMMMMMGGRSMPPQNASVGLERFDSLLCRMVGRPARERYGGGCVFGTSEAKKRSRPQSTPPTTRKKKKEFETTRHIRKSKEEEYSKMSWLDQKMSSQKVSYTLPTAMPNPFGDPPKKYAKSKSNNMMKLNPEWKQWKDEQQQKVQQQQQQQQQPPPPGAHKQQQPAAAATAASMTIPAVATAPTTMTVTALPVVTSLADHAELNEISVANGGKEMPLSESTNATIELYQQDDITKETGLSADTAMDAICEILSKYEVPIGLMNKLLLLSQYDILEFILDDSGSMVQFSDTVHPVTGQSMTRWEEAQSRLLEMMELLAHLPFQTILVHFLNRPTKLTFVRNGRSPSALYKEVMVPQINAAFTPPPQGSTPFLEKLQSSFQMHQNNKSVARWFFGDGVPNGGSAAQDRITLLLQQRAQPEQNPVTFISCSNDDNEVLWMKDAEEVAPYVSEADDYIDEATEVLKDQGSALPYTKGFHLVCQLVAASCPDDLDAMDESVPLSKPTLDNLLGLQHTETAYRYYFDAFLTAQKNRTTVDQQAAAVDQWKKQMNWNNLYQDLLTAGTSHQLSAVQQYRAELQRLEAAATASSSK